MGLKAFGTYLLGIGVVGSLVDADNITMGVAILVVLLGLIFWVVGILYIDYTNKLSAKRGD